MLRDLDIGKKLERIIKFRFIDPALSDIYTILADLVTQHFLAIIIIINNNFIIILFNY